MLAACFFAVQVLVLKVLTWQRPPFWQLTVQLLLLNLSLACYRLPGVQLLAQLACRDTQLTPSSDWRIKGIMTEVANASALFLCREKNCPGTDRLGGPPPSSSAHRLSTSELLGGLEWADSANVLCCSAAVLASQCRAPISPVSPAENEPAWATLLLDMGSAQPLQVAAMQAISFSKPIVKGHCGTSGLSG